MKYDILEVINQIIRDGTKSSVNNSTYSESALDDGHFIISLKFFNFVSEADIYKEQREVEIIRTISFIDIEGFDSSFTDILLNNQHVSVKTNPKNYTLLNLKNLIEAISAQDLEKYSQVNSILCSLIIEIMRIQNSTYFFFGFIDQNDYSLLESTVSLEIMNKFKNVNPDYFFEFVQDMNIDISNMNDNNNLKEEFYSVENIFSEIIFYVEKTHHKHCKNKNLVKVEKLFDKDFYNSIKDLTQVEKYANLKNHLIIKNFILDSNPQLKNIYDSVEAFFNNRSKWKNLSIARDEILKMNFNYKEAESVRESKNITSNNNINFLLSKEEPSSNETDDLKSILRNLSKVKVVKNVEENENNSIFE